MVRNYKLGGCLDLQEVRESAL